MNVPIPQSSKLVDLVCIVWKLAMHKPHIRSSRIYQLGAEYIVDYLDIQAVLYF